MLVVGALPFDGNTLSSLKDRVTSGRCHIPFYMTTGEWRLPLLPVFGHLLLLVLGAGEGGGGGEGGGVV